MASSLYDILGINSSATNEDIKTAYKKLAKKYHPDKNAGSTWHEEQFKSINQAYQILSDPSKRKHYDIIKEYEAFQRSNPRPNPAPKKTPDTVRKTTHTNRTEPPRNSNNQRQPDSTKKKFQITIPETKINILVISYYVVLIGFGIFIMEFSKYKKIKEQYALAARYEKIGDYTNAEKVYNNIISIDEELPEAYERRAMVKMHLKGFILEDLSKAIKYSSSPSDSLFFKRAKCYYQLNDYTSAILDLDNILLNEESTIDSAYLYKANCNYHLNNFEGCIPDYTTYIASHPTSGESFSKRGFAYFQQRNYKKALSDYNVTINWERENGEHYFYRGLIKFALKDSTNGCVDITDSFLLGYSNALTAKNSFCNH